MQLHLDAQLTFGNLGQIIKAGLNKAAGDVMYVRNTSNRHGRHRARC